VAHQTEVIEEMSKDLAIKAIDRVDKDTTKINKEINSNNKEAEAILLVKEIFLLKKILLFLLIRISKILLNQSINYLVLKNSKLCRLRPSYQSYLMHQEHILIS
jgi:hypothetical protein